MKSVIRTYKKYLNLLLVPLEPQLEKEYLAISIKSNIRLMNFMLPITAMLEIHNLINVCFVSAKGLSTNNNLIYFGFYLSLLLMTAIISLVHIYYLKNKAQQGTSLINIYYIYLFLFCLWSTALTIYDLQSSYNISIYTNALLLIAILFPIKPLRIFSLIIVCHTILLTFAASNSSPEVSFYGIYLNTTIIAITTFFISAVQYVNKIEEIKNRKLLTEQNKQLKLLNAKLNQLSITDALSNLYNRRFFDNSLPEYWQYCVNNQYPFAILILDIDNFKIFNDTYGHRAGDNCLKAVSQGIEKTLASENERYFAVCRYGGEEFAVILANMSQDKVFAKAEEIRNNIADLQMENKLAIACPYLTISIGIAWDLADPNSNPQQFVEKADQALYIAKSTGRNKTIISS
ncbi:MAG: diguanylate cyclase [Clostridiales bacterium]